MGMYEYDNNFIFLPWEDAQSFLLTNKNTQTLEIFLKDHNFSDKDIINSYLLSKIREAGKNQTYILSIVSNGLIEATVIEVDATASKFIINRLDLT